MEYDYSKSRGAHGIIRYYPEISDPHNMMNSAFYPSYAEKEIRRLTQQCDGLSPVFDMKRPACKISEEEGKRAAQIDFNKQYPLTLFENQCILNSYLTFLEANDIKPIIVIMPAHSYYTRYVPGEKRALFYHALNEVLTMHDVQVLDYLDNFDCPDTCYYHVSHFNETGAEEFTKQLIRDIEW